MEEKLEEIKTLTKVKLYSTTKKKYANLLKKSENIQNMIDGNIDGYFFF